VKLEKTALKATSWLGSIESLIVHTALFIVSFSLVLFGVAFDRVLLVLRQCFHSKLFILPFLYKCQSIKIP
jgi:hypothetical protein